MGKIPILPYLEGLDLKIQKYQAPNFTIETVLKLKIYRKRKKICPLFQLDFEPKGINMSKIPVLPYLEGSEGLDSKIQKAQAPDFTIYSRLRPKIFLLQKKICLLFQLDFEPQGQNRSLFTYLFISHFSFLWQENFWSKP